MYSRTNLRDNHNNTTLELQRDLVHCTPEQCVVLTHSVPSVQMYYALRSKLENCTEKWLVEFLQLNGLDSLLNSLDQMSGGKFTCFTDAILQMDCISCIKCILNYSLGLEFFIKNELYTKKLTMVLNSSDALPKKQVFEILYSICVYNHIGYLRVVEALSYVKSECDQLHRFSLILHDLQKSETVAHKTAVMTFVNAIINCTPDITERMRIRNEFIGLNLLDVLMFLRREEPDENLIVQLEIFHERKVGDEESMNTCNNLDYNSPQDLLDQIQARVFGTSRMVNFINILQDLLAIETVYNKKNSKLWQTVDSVVHHIVHVNDSREQAPIPSHVLYALPEHVKQGLQHLHQYTEDCHHQIYTDKDISKGLQQPETSHNTCMAKNITASIKDETTNENITTNAHTITKLHKCRTHSAEDITYIDSSSDYNSSTRTGTLLESQSTADNSTMVVKPRVISPSCDLTYFVNDMNSTASEPLQESSHNGIQMISGKQNLSDEDNTSSSSNYNSVGNKTSQYDQNKIYKEFNIVCPDFEKYLLNKDMDTSSKCKKSKLVSQLKIPRPSTTLREFKWITMPDQDVVDYGSCIWLRPLSQDDQVEINFDKLEVLFQVTSPECQTTIEEVVLLDADTRLKINLFLNRLDSGAEDLVQNLQEGNKKQLSLPMLQYLNSIMPSAQEISMLQKYVKPRLELGMAEQFVLLLSDIPDYQLLLQALLVQAEFDSCILKFKTSLSSLIKLARLVLESTDLRVLLHAVLVVGNFLNHDKYNGDAPGFQLTSIQRLAEVKSSSPCKNLLHYITQTVIKERPSVLGFIKNVLSFENTTNCSMEDLRTDISKLNNKLRFVVMRLAKTNDSLRAIFQPFIESLRRDFSVIQSSTTELRTLSDHLAGYFCEDPADFDMQESFRCLVAFCKEMKKCHTETMFLSWQDNESKKHRDHMNNKLRSKIVTLEFGRNAGASSSMMESKPKLMDILQNRMHCGNFQPYRTDVHTPEKDLDHPLEMSCIPFIGSPRLLSQNMRSSTSESVFLDTPELVYNIAGDAVATGNKKMIRTSTQDLKPIRAVCTAQTRPTDSRGKLMSTSSPINAAGTAQPSATLQRKLFGGDQARKDEDNTVKKQTSKPRQQLEIPSRSTGHRRSRSDLLDSVCIPNKWIQYEKIRTYDIADIGQAPVAEPESTCNLSTLNLESRGKFLTNREITAYKSEDRLDGDNFCEVEKGPQVKAPEVQLKRKEKKSTSGGFFSKLGRAVLKPRNTYSDGDQYGKPPKEQRKKLSSCSEKENLNENCRVESSEKLGEFQRGSDGNTNRLSRFFQRGGLYRSSKMKKKNQKAVV